MSCNGAPEFALLDLQIPDIVGILRKSSVRRLDNGKELGMPAWKGIVGRGFRPQEFREYVGGLTFGDWRPQFVVVHNTSVPRLSQWHDYDGQVRMRGLQHYYRDEKRWSAGPHLFVADDLIWVFTPLTTSGVHSPSWNGVSWGVEMVGEYEVEDFSPAVRENTVDALATLHLWRALDPETLRFHKEDPRTSHGTCPGRKVDKNDLIRRVRERMGQGLGGESTGEHEPARPDIAGGAPEAGVMRAAAALAPILTAGPEASHSLFTNITSTEFGGGDEAGMDSAYGGKVDPDALEASLPARVASSKRSVRVYHRPSGRSVVCKVNDVGPWNTTDKYWDSGARPLAESQFRNRTRAGNGRVPSNDAGIDLTPAVFEEFGVRGPINTRQMHVDWEFA
jgi:hypothetical protein